MLEKVYSARVVDSFSRLEMDFAPEFGNATPGIEGAPHDHN